jgi:hypothetical protein
MSLIQGNSHKSSVSGFYPKTIEGSLRFNDDDSAYLSYVASSGSRTKFTISCWTKIAVGSTHTIFGGGDYDPDGAFRFFVSSSGRLNVEDYDTPAGSYNIRWSMPSTGPLLRDPSAWYHIVLSVDTTPATPEINIYVNGEDWGSYWTKTNSPTQNDTFHVNIDNKNQYIGYSSLGTLYADGYMGEYFFLDGEVKQASDFAETKNGVWVPKNITASDFAMANNSFHLTFQDDTEVEAFNTVLYRGDGSGNQNITGMGMNADLYWIKRRDASGGWNSVDTVRGPYKRLELHSTGADFDQTLLQSFDSDGFTTGVTGVGESGGSYVAFGWDAGANNAITGHSSVTWQGDDTNNREISGFPFTPDLIWIGPKTFNGANKQIYDSVRGFGLGKDLISNGISAEGGESPTYGGIQSVTKYGFRTKSGSSGGGLEDTHINMYQNATYYPGITGEYVAWGWDAGDGDAVTDTSGTNVSSVTRKTSTANGFSIIDYTVTSANNSATKLVPHGLGGNPDWMMIKKYTNNASDNQRWAVYHSGLADDQFLKLGNESTDGAGTSSSVFDDSAFTTDTFAVGSSGMVGGHPSFDESYICYAWKAVSGKSAFGTYTGTGSSQTISTGFRVGWLMVKATSTSGQSWFMIDGSRSPFNNNDVDFLAADTSGVEQSSSVNDIDFHETDGFTVKGTGNLTNGNLVEYVYMAFKGSYSDYITDYNTDGTNIDSRVKANQTTGFSIVSYKGSGTASDSFGHGLGTAPSWVIIKDRDLANSWLVQHSSVTGYLTLNSTNAVTGSNQLTFGASTVTLNGTWDIMNGSGRSYIAYCWAEKSGYSKFDSYSGATNEITVYTTDDGTSSGTNPFKPAFVLIKRTDIDPGDAYWVIFDNTRDVEGDNGRHIIANLSGAESDSVSRKITFNDNGFTIPASASADASVNAGSGTYIYAAFADTREAAFWLDQSGNDNDWQPVNLDHNDTLLDSPTDNFATFNPLAIAKYNATGFRTLGTFSDGNLTLTTNADNESGTVTFGASSGKYYMEFTSVSLAQRQQIIVYSTDDYRSDTGAVTTSSDGSGNATDRVSWTTGDVIGIAVDIDSNKVWFHKNGDWFGTSNPSTPTGGDTLNAFTGVGVRQDSGSTGNAIISFNAGQQPFKYDPPA